MIIIYYIASALRVYIIIIYKTVLYNYYHQVRRIGALAIRGHSWTGRRWWKSLNPVYLSTRYGNDSRRERIYIKYIVFRRRRRRHRGRTGAARRLIIPMGGVRAWKTGRGLTPAPRGEGELFAGTSGAARRPGHRMNRRLRLARARVYSVLYCITLKVIFSCHPAAPPRPRQR